MRYGWPLTKSLDEVTETNDHVRQKQSKTKITEQ